MKPLAALTTTILATGLAVVGVAAPASAHNQEVTSTCSAVTVNLTDYRATVPATETTYKTVPNPNYVPASTVTTYQRYSWTGGNQSTAPTEVPPSANWQANTSNYHKGDPVNEPYMGASGNWFYWLKTVTVTPASGDPTIQVVDHQGTPEKTNHVTVTIDGVTTPLAADTDFSTTYNNTFTFANSTESHSWTVVVTAWDDPTGSHGWTKTINGTSTPCVAPTFTVAQCTSPGQSSQGSYFIPVTSGVKYYVKVNGGSYGQKASGTYYPSFGQIITVQARSSNGNTVYVTYPSVEFRRRLPDSDGCGHGDGVVSDVYYEHRCSERWFSQHPGQRERQVLHRRVDDSGGAGDFCSGCHWFAHGSRRC